MATHSSMLAWLNPKEKGAWQATVPGVQRVGPDLATTPPPARVYLKIPPWGWGGTIMKSHIQTCLTDANSLQILN